MKKTLFALTAALVSGAFSVSAQSTAPVQNLATTARSQATATAPKQSNNAATSTTGRTAASTAETKEISKAQKPKSDPARINSAKSEKATKVEKKASPEMK